MEYIKEINRFYDWLETNNVSDSSIVLWHALMHINNKCGWRQEFAVAISTLELKTGLSKSSVIRARNILQQVGRVEFKSRNGQQSAIYSMIAFHTDTQTATQTVTQSGTQTATQTVPISKTRLEETKLNNSKSHSSGKPPAKEKPPKEKKELNYWKPFVTEFDAWYKQKIGGSYNYMPKDFAHLKKIYQFLEKRAEEKQFAFTEENLIKAFKFFLQKAWDKDDWLKRNFTIPNLLSQFNQIVNGTPKTSKQPTGAEVSAGSLFGRINSMPD